MRLSRCDGEMQKPIQRESFTTPSRISGFGTLKIAPRVQVDDDTQRCVIWVVISWLLVRQSSISLGRIATTRRSLIVDSGSIVTADSVVRLVDR